MAPESPTDPLMDLQLIPNRPPIDPLWINFFENSFIPKGPKIGVSKENQSVILSYNNSHQKIIE